MIYQIELTARARKSLSKLQKAEIREVQAVLELLKTNPRPPAVKRLKGSKYLRIRLGKIRIIYVIQNEKLLILILDVGHRREIYRWWNESDLTSLSWIQRDNFVQILSYQYKRKKSGNRIEIELPN